MENQELLTSSNDLPFLPTEIKHHILRFCDPSTLARACRVSLAFLQLSSPILYQDVEIIGLKNLEKLFCFRGEGNDVDRPQLHPYLDLLHFRTLTIVATSEIARTGEVCDLFDSRIFIPSSSPASGPTVSIDLLVLRPIAVLLPLDDNTAELNRWYSIYKILNPKFVHIFGLPASPLDVPLGSSIPRFDFKDYIIWDQLEQLKITNAINNQDQLFFAHSLQHHAHPVVVFDLSSRWGVDLYELTLEEAALYEMNPETMGEGVKEWVLLMGSQSQKERCSQSLEVHWREDGMGDEEVAKARRKVRFEVVQ